MKQALLELEAQARARITLGAGGRYWEAALTFAQLAQQALREGKPADAYLEGALSPHALRELSKGLPLALRKIAAQAASAAAVDAQLSYYPVMPWQHRQEWSACGRRFSGTHRGLSAIYCALLSPGEPIDGRAFLAPHRQLALAVSLRDTLQAATAKICSVAPALAGVLRFEVSRAGAVRYIGAARVQVEGFF